MAAALESRRIETRSFRAEQAVDFLATAERMAGLFCAESDQGHATEQRIGGQRCC